MTILQLMMHRNSVVNHTVVLSPDPAFQSVFSPSTPSLNVTANVSNGVGPFTYSWSWDSGGSGMVINNPTSNPCTLTTSNGSVGLRTGVLKCDVVDTGNGSYSASDTVTAELEIEL